MEHAAHLSGERLELGERVIEGVALMDDTVQPGLGGDFELLLENVGLLLFVTRIFELELKLQLVAGTLKRELRRLRLTLGRR